VIDKRPLFQKLPSRWIDADGLKRFVWGPSGGDEIAALIVLTVIAHHIDRESGIARLSYSQIAEMASLSRAKVSAGLKILSTRGLIEATHERSSYQLSGYDPKARWAMFPVRGLYRNDVVEPFQDFKLRRRIELDALKLYYLFAARRNNNTRLALIGYEKITESTGVTANYIKPAVSLLAAHGLIHVEHVQSKESETGVVNGYRLTHLPWQPKTLATISTSTSDSTKAERGAVDF
jgi:DNA-binding IscR family transcriptional regulator